MVFEIRFSREAEEDILESFLWYETQKPGLGEIFLATLDYAAESIKMNPKAFRIRYKKKVRAFVMNQFPFLILYGICMRLRGRANILFGNPSLRLRSGTEIKFKD